MACTPAKTDSLESRNALPPQPQASGLSTDDLGATDNNRSPDSPPPQPEAIGRYRIERVLGKGSFGLVYLAHDEQLQRQVAIKVAHRERVSTAAEAEAYLLEARTVANLDHPHIVPVHDVGSTADHPYFIVSKWIAGGTLAERMQNHRPLPLDAAELVATIAAALHYAHGQGLVHRDIKPGNILINSSGQPFVVDFGLALREENVGRGHRHVGTPAYMSPEQARGEGHRVDGRSDIFSLGVVFYELLVGRLPFKADTQAELREQITTFEPRPPRQCDDSIPKELERICLKALSKRASERYSTAKDLAEDLRHFLTQQSPAATMSAVPATPPPAAPSSAPDSDSQPLRIVPKGLRSFDAHDADFFLELLPGPRDRDGLPDSLRFWKIRIEEQDPDNTFAVGLIYGPSGCGKSSLVKAGLLPRLSDQVLTVYVEAAADETEVRLLNGLRKSCPALADDLSLTETLAALRRGQGIPAEKKVLIVLDQFEQWLHAKKEEQNTELVQALRQCDGGRLQCVVMVRDDFWLAVSRFLRDLEVRLVEGQNSALADLFDLDHARKVLAAFGKLPEHSGDTSHDQQEFLTQAVAGLAQEGKVISVRLALFAEMMKGKTWTPATLRAVGGTEGVGVTFLEETFSAATAPPEHRYHQKAARNVLKSLLPESGTDIKGHMRSAAELLAASGYDKRPRDFAELLRLLDHQLRLITPTDPEGQETSVGSAVRTTVRTTTGDALVRTADPTVRTTPAEQLFYQLTHDYLVPALRDWLTRKQKETRRGRAELLLADRAAVWKARPENRQLPSLLQWLQIQWLTLKKNWTPNQQKMMRQAGRLHGLRVGIAVGLVLLATFTGIQIRNSVAEQQQALRAQGLVDALLNAEIAQVPAIVRDLDDRRRWADPLLRRELTVAKPASREELHLALALLPVDESQAAWLRAQLPVVLPQQFPVVRDALLPHREKLVEPLWQVALDAQKPIQSRFQAACALATYAPTDARWEQVGDLVSGHLVTRQASDLIAWRQALLPAKNRLLPSLGTIYRDATQREQPRAYAAETLAEYAADEPAVLVDLLADAEPFQFPVILEQLKPAPAVPLAAAELGKQPAQGASEEDQEQLAKRQANLAVALVRLGAAEQAWPLLKHTPDPRARSYLIHWLAPLGADPQRLIQRLEVEPDVSIRRALLLALGEFNELQLPPAQREPLLPKLVTLYETDPDAGLHAAAEWLLRTWGANQQLQSVVAQLRANPKQGAELVPGEKRNWFINSQGQTLVLLEPADFPMGSPAAEPSRQDDEVAHRRKIGRRFALLAHEVTQAQFRLCQAARPEIWKGDISLYVRTDDSPQGAVTWYEVAAYCNWLSEQDGLPPDQWCYEPNAAQEYAAGMKAKPHAGKLLGYRLPTEGEWEYACRAGAATSRHYGSSESLLLKYAWFVTNADNRTWPVGRLKPNDFGVFDLLGNSLEWTHDPYGGYPDLSQRTRGATMDTVHEEAVAANQNRVLRGGSFGNRPPLVRSAFRYFNLPTTRDASIGFRLARTLPHVPLAPLPPNQ